MDSRLDRIEHLILEDQRCKIENLETRIKRLRSSRPCVTSVIEKGGWATAMGHNIPNAAVAKACAQQRVNIKA